MAFESGALQLSLHDSPHVATLTRLSSVSERVEWGETKRSDKYYIESGDVVFQVEETLFRVHRYFFLRESQPFRDMLSLPVPAPTEPSSSTSTSKGKFKAFDVEGISDDNPIHLLQVSVDEFEDFLWVFYNPTYSNYYAPLKTWSSILRLAHRWDFPSIRELAFRELERPDRPILPVPRIVLGEKYDAPGDWRARALTELGLRREPLTLAEGQELGVEMVFKISALRKRVEKDGRGSRYRGWSYNYERSRSRSPHTLRRRPSSPRSHSPQMAPIQVIQPPVIIQQPPSPPQPPNPWDWVNVVPPFPPPPPPQPDGWGEYHWTPPVVIGGYEHSPSASSASSQSGDTKQHRIVRLFKFIFGRGRRIVNAI